MTRTGITVVVAVVGSSGAGGVVVSVRIIWDIGSTSDKISAGRCYRSWMHW